MKRTAALVALVFVVAGAVSATATADPLNSNSLALGFACDNGVTFTGVSIAQNNTSTGHVIASNDASLLHSMFQAVRITVDGTVVKEIPGFVGRSLVKCTLVSVAGEPISGVAIVLSGFFTGKH